MSSVWPRDCAAVREGLAAGCSRVGRFPVLRRVAGTVVQRSPPEPHCPGSAPACAAACCVMLDKSLGNSELRLPRAPAPPRASMPACVPGLPSKAALPVEPVLHGAPGAPLPFPPLHRGRRKASRGAVSSWPRAWV